MRHRRGRLDGRAADERWHQRKDGSRYTSEVGAIGVVQQRVFEYNALTAVGGATKFTGVMFENTWQGLLRFPQKIPAVIVAIGGAERDVDCPVSVVGASRLGGEAVDRGLWQLFWLMLAGLNFFVGVFNLLPLLPLDGGHIAVNLYERVRNWIRKLRGLPEGVPVVKAFNTNFAQHMDSGHLGKDALTALIATDDEAARQVVTALAKAIGFDPVSAGPLRNARWLETLGFLNIQLGYVVGHGTATGFRYLHG